MLSFRFKCLTAAMLLLLHLPTTVAIAVESADNTPDAGQGDISSAVDSFETPDDQEDYGELAGIKTVGTLTTYGGFAGYRFLNADGNAGRAEQFVFLHSGVVAGGYLDTLGQNLKFATEGTYLNQNDYHGDLLFDKNGEYRIHIKTEALYHNLQRETLFGSERLTLGTAIYEPKDTSAADHGIKTDQSLVDFRYKLHNFPMHINLGYWNLKKEGNRQLIFADSAFKEKPDTLNKVLATSRSVNQQTHGGTVALDTHFGPVDFIYYFQIRQFENNSAIPNYPFDARPQTAGTSYLGEQHNEDPESRYLSHTVKLHTSLSGGIVGASSYTYGKRENRSNLSDFIGARESSTTLQNGAGDLVYTPFKELSFALKFRRQEVDNTSPTKLYDKFASPDSIAVRRSPDTLKNITIATLSLKPSNMLTINAEYKGEFLHRDLPSTSDERLTWSYLNENQETHRGTLALLSRPLKGLNVSARYSYQKIDHPTYGTTFSSKHEGNLLSTYNVAGKWGVTAAYRSSRENNDEILSKLIVENVNSISYEPFNPLLWRDKATNDLNAGIWFTPLKKLTVSVNYGFLRNNIDQAVMFSVIKPPAPAPPPTAVASNYTSQAQIYSMSAVYQYTDKLDISLALQQIHSFAEFDPVNAKFSDTSNTEGIKVLSRLKTVESSFSARASYNFTRYMYCSIDYSLRDYNDKYSSLYDGTVHSVTAFLSTKW